MSEKLKYCLSIAGFDPSGGAGILADIKTFESHDVMGLGVCTSITYQHEASFEGVDWLSTEQIIKQLDVLLEQYPVNYFKVGLIESLSTLTEVVSYIRKAVPNAFIIWDPILKASAGFEFHNDISVDLNSFALDLITPNLDEIKALGDPKNIAKETAVLLKGGHATEHANDILYVKEEQYLLETLRIEGASKHGSGCVLSAAILANLAKGKSLFEACSEAKRYISTFLASTDTLLGKHALTMTAL